jgi:hypothetical protein
MKIVGFVQMHIIDDYFTLLTTRLTYFDVDVDVVAVAGAPSRVKWVADYRRWL